MQQQPPPPPSAPPPPPGYPQPYGFVQPPQGWTPPPPVSQRRWWFWGCGGCAALVLVVIAVIAFVFLRIFNSSPLRQFPTEAGANTTQDNFVSANNQTTETVLIVDSHSLVEVETYYQTALNANGWSTATHDPSQASSGDQWTIERPAVRAQGGTVTFTTVPGGTDISVVFNY
ncbi:MAG: hypothetical protein M3Z57_03020 [Candidatus Dormibacteraeota bacterium]|nr:hypothetical protein [Candidatus Dormibacteraeota bacterium]